MLLLTGAQNHGNIDHIEIAVSTEYLEQQIGPASGNATVSLIACMKCDIELANYYKDFTSAKLG